jgi:hypothetical protein
MLQDEITITSDNSTASFWALFTGPKKQKRDLFVFLPQHASLDNTYEVFPSTSSPVGIHDIYQSEAFLLMLASEDTLKREWDTPEEDEAWQDLIKAK